jgi:hypothetical protein
MKTIAHPAEIEIGYELTPLLLTDYRQFGFYGETTLSGLAKRCKGTEVKIALKTGEGAGATSFIVPDAGLLEDKFKLLQSRRIKFISFLTNIDRIHPGITNFKKTFDSQTAWRTGSSSISLSYPQCTGYQKTHADAVDVFIFQTSGKRNWKIWREESCSPEYRYNLFLGKFGQDWEGSGTDPDWELTLLPGQGLFIPAFCPHLAVTDPDSGGISISYAVGIKTFTKLDFLASDVNSEKLNENLFDLTRKLDCRGSMSAKDLKQKINQL